MRCIAFTINKKHIYIAYTSWICASIFNWTGTLCGFAAGAPVPQAFFYATWKLLASICLSVVSYIVFQVRIATKKVYKHQMRRESLDVRYKPKSTGNIAEDMLGSVKDTTLSLQRSFTDTVEKVRSKHSKNNSVSMSQSTGNGNSTPGTGRGHFNMPDTTILPPSLNDDTIEDSVEDCDPEIPDPNLITTPKRAPGMIMSLLSIERVKECF